MSLDPNLKDISVVVPTLNSRELIEPVREALGALFSQVGELVFVDSESTDGTLDYLKAHFSYPHAQFHTRPKGLYESWNFGISQCQRPWLTIATSGDVLSVEDLRYLLEVGRHTEADVVCAAPVFVDEQGGACEDRKWPIFDLLQQHEGEELVQPSNYELTSFVLRYARPARHYKGWLGSSASNLYRTELLQAHPFPTHVGRSGDTYWSLAHAHEVKAVFCRRRCGTFVVHEKTNSLWGEKLQPIYASYQALCRTQISWLAGEVAKCAPVENFHAVLDDILRAETDPIPKLRSLKKKRNELTLALKQAKRELRAYRKDFQRLRRRVPKRWEEKFFPNTVYREAKDRKRQEAAEARAQAKSRAQEAS